MTYRVQIHTAHSDLTRGRNPKSGFCLSTTENNEKQRCLVETIQLKSNSTPALLKKEKKLYTSLFSNPGAR
jgi:hypothetical protein